MNSSSNTFLSSQTLKMCRAAFFIPVSRVLQFDWAMHAKAYAIPAVSCTICAINLTMQPVSIIESIHTHMYRDSLAYEFDSLGKNLLKLLSVFGSLTFAVLYDIIC